MTSIPPVQLVSIERLHAPQKDGEILSRPALSQGVEIARKNAARLNSSPLRIAGLTLQEFRLQVRGEALETAREWMSSELGIETAPQTSGLLFVTGHQPQLNHPGVWLKNVSVSRLADCCHGTGLNLIVDNDLAGIATVRCPAGTPDAPRFEEIPFDAPWSTQPWEELHLQDRDLFESFAERVDNHMAGWQIQPLLENFWPAAIDCLNRTTETTTLLSACRIAQERAWGMSNLELPVSRMCRMDSFLLFVSHLCLNFEKLHADYQRAVRDYRTKYRVRNNRHPVPDLEQKEDQLELPFWYWEEGAHDRCRLFARRTQDNGVELSFGDRVLTVLRDDELNIERLRKLQSEGRLRTRALTTTLFARLCLGDLFIHGIGGARYDEITDNLIHLFFDFPAPQFVTLTATLHLPVPSFEVTKQRVQQLLQEIRHLRFTGSDEETSAEAMNLQIRRAELLAAIREDRAAEYSKSQRRVRRPETRRRHRELVRIRDELARMAVPEIERKEQELAQLKAELRANSVLKSREFAACLFPQEKLRGLVDKLRVEVCGRSV